MTSFFLHTMASTGFISPDSSSWLNISDLHWPWKWSPISASTAPRSPDTVLSWFSSYLMGCYITVLLAASSFFVNPLKCQHFSESHPQYSRLKLLQTPVTMCMLWLSNIVQAWMALLSSRPTYLISMVIFRWISAASSNSGCSKLNSSLIIQIYFSI